MASVAKRELLPQLMCNFLQLPGDILQVNLLFLYTPGGVTDDKLRR